MNAKEAFKLGFVLEMAKNHTSPEDLCKGVEKCAVVRGAFGPLAGGALGAGYATGVGLPSSVGSGISGFLDDATNKDSDSVRLAKKKYFAAHLKDLIRAEKIKKTNRFLSNMIKEDRNANKRKA